MLFKVKYVNFKDGVETPSPSRKAMTRRKTALFQIRGGVGTAGGDGHEVRVGEEEASLSAVIPRLLKWSTLVRNRSVKEKQKPEVTLWRAPCAPNLKPPPYGFLSTPPPKELYQL